jgi:hypothetical protein
LVCIGLICFLAIYTTTTTHITHHGDSDSKQAARHRYPWAQHPRASLRVFACCSEPHTQPHFYADNKWNSRRRCEDTVSQNRGERHTSLRARLGEEARSPLDAQAELIAGR